MYWYVAWAPTPSNDRLGEVYIGLTQLYSLDRKLIVLSSGTLDNSVRVST
jgi:hypothetical protein